MPIVYCELELFLPYCHSLKEKRQILRKVQDRLRANYNFSIAEINHQDLWQRATLGAVTVGADHKLLEKLAHQLVDKSAEILGDSLTSSTIEFVD
jgi:uncharacterized protein